jgi:L-lactate dehydrogenase complex protein LldG
MSSRDAILSAIRGHTQARQRDLPTVPLFETPMPNGLVAEFTRRLHQMGGKLLEPGPPGDLLASFRPRLDEAKVVCSNVPEVPGNRDLSATKSPRDLHDVDVAVLRAAFGVAETGSVCFTEAELGVNSVAYLAQHLIVLLEAGEIVPNLHHAYRRPEFHRHRYTVFHTGPSATADIEGVLIHGAQGVRSLSVLLLPQSA